MAHTALFRTLRRLAREQHDARVLGHEVQALRDARMEARVRRLSLGEPGPVARGRGLGRRGFVAGSAAAIGLGACVGPMSGQPTIAIVGGGIAGLTAALTLLDAGYRATIYEALPNRVGGRMLSDRASRPGCGSCHTVSSPATFGWDDDHVTDVFGEMIDTSHETMRALAERFGLTLVDSLAAEPAGATETYYFSGAHYPADTAATDFAALYDALSVDLEAAGYPTTYASSTAAGRAIDAMSVRDWIGSRVSGGLDSPLGKLLDTAYAIEFGADTTDQSALNLLYLLGYASTDAPLSVFGESDERYRIQEGIDRLPAAIANTLGAGAIQQGWVLEAIARRGDRYELTFDAGSAQTVMADYVVLALPFSSLRNVDYGGAGFDMRKDQAIRELGAGRNGKLQLQFTERLWNTPGPWGLSNGTYFTDTGCQAGWEPSRGYPGTSGILLKYTGGAATDLFAQTHSYDNTANEPDVRTDAMTFLSELEPVFPGISRLWNGKAAGSMAHRNRFWGSSYAYWRVGQGALFGGHEQARQGNVFFAGEHTSTDFQGFMEGAASTGVAAGEEILASIRGT
ncbi:MAG: FAD-dependent oxidoreductase [Sandaracinaceae bacterium]|nr:FAD-dependent oxidoreductase [Sandaracinaceae bacterium]